MIEKLKNQQVLPAVTFNRAEDALPVTEALLKGGITIMEVALRTEIAFETIGALQKTSLK